MLGPRVGSNDVDCRILLELLNHFRADPARSDY
jgi:hypothetical protein